MKQKSLLIILGVIAFAFIFQTMLRYQYYKEGSEITRIDRLTQKECTMPCIPPPPPTPVPPTPKPTPFNKEAAKKIYDSVKEEHEQDGIQLAKQSIEGEKLFARHGDGTYLYKIVDDASTFLPSPNQEENLSNLPNEITICFCNKDNDGWDWEYHVDTQKIYFINEDSDLMKKHGMK